MAMVIVGKTGCGKTTLGRCIVGAHPPTSGKSFRRPRGGGAMRNISRRNRAAQAELARDIRIMFQNPYGALNPRMTVFDILAERPRVHGEGDDRDLLEARVAARLELVGLRPDAVRRYPHAFSGGQRQSIGIARAYPRPRHRGC